MIISSQTPSISDPYNTDSVFRKKTQQDNSNPSGSTAKSANQQKVPGINNLTPEQQKEVNELKARDAEVRAHEMAHIIAGGRYIRGGAHYSYGEGPDGKEYAIGGEVSIDTSPESTPDATIAKMKVVERAALAPADPSSEDRSVAAEAENEIMVAEQEKAQESTDSNQQSSAVTPHKKSAVQKTDSTQDTKTNGSVGTSTDSDTSVETTNSDPTKTNANISDQPSPPTDQTNNGQTAEAAAINKMLASQDQKINNSDQTTTNPDTRTPQEKKVDNAGVIKISTGQKDKASVKNVSPRIKLSQIPLVYQKYSTNQKNTARGSLVNFVA